MSTSEQELKALMTDALDGNAAPFACCSNGSAVSC